MLASIAPDIDGAGAIAEILTRNSATPLFWWTDYHHVIAHNLVFAMIAATLCAIAALRRHVLAGALGFAAVHLHLLGDLVGARGPDGYDWPIVYLFPFRPDVTLTWGGQWALNAWPNIALTIVLLVVTFILAPRRGYSPVGLLSQRAVELVVGALRARFSRLRSS
ncbi:MAG: metal-dependent hydrolase [Thermoanaerobaculia bacterium]